MGDSDPTNQMSQHKLILVKPSNNFLLVTSCSKPVLCTQSCSSVHIDWNKCLCVYMTYCCLPISSVQFSHSLPENCCSLIFYPVTTLCKHHILYKDVVFTPMVKQQLLLKQWFSFSVALEKIM